MTADLRWLKIHRRPGASMRCLASTNKQNDLGPRDSEDSRTPPKARVRVVEDDLPSYAEDIAAAAPIFVIVEGGS